MLGSHNSTEVQFLTFQTAVHEDSDCLTMEIKHFDPLKCQELNAH